MKPRPESSPSGVADPARALMGWIWLCGLALCLSSGLARAQSPPEVEAHLSVDSVQIGEQFTLSLVAESPAESTVSFPSVDAGSGVFGDLRPLERGRVQSRHPSASLRVDSVAYTVTTFTLGSAQIPVLPVRIVEAGDTTIAANRPMRLHVVSVVNPDATGLRTPPALASFPRPIWVWGAFVLVGLVLVGGVAYAWWRFRGERAQSSESDEQSDDPYQTAVKKLEQLTRRNPNDPVTGKAFYVELTQALRVYLARRVGVKALECTTSELITALRRRSEIPRTAADRIQPVLERADFVKFAGAKPDPEKSQALLKEARGVLDAVEAAMRRSERQTGRVSTAA